MSKKIYLSLFLAVVFAVLSVVPAVAADTQIAYAKISNDLLSEFNAVDSNESVKIFVWLDDSSTEEYQDVVSGLDESMNVDVDVSQINVLNANASDDAENDSTQTIENIQNTIMQKRQIAQVIYLEENTKVAEKLVDEGGEVIYISRYSPLIVFEATFSEAVDVAKNSNVVSLGSTKMRAEKLMSVALQATGINSLSSSQFSAEGIKIGMIEGDEYVDLSVAPFYAKRNKIQVLGSNSSGHSHANAVGAALLATVSDFAMLYSAGYEEGENGEQYDLLTKTETLISAGVNVINYSVALYVGHTSYSEYSRWFDHIAYNHSVHCVFGVGNEGTTQTSTLAMSYNGIGVGGINDRNTPQTSDDTRYDDSSYNYGNNSLPYKPDFSAPAVALYLNNMSVPQSVSGTSIAAPQVTGIVAALCSHTPLLLTKQALMKSVLSASVSKRTALNYDTMSDANGEISMGYKPYGSGIVNAYNAIELLEDGNYVAGSITNSETEDVFSLGTIQAGETVTITLSFLKRVRFSSTPHESEGDNMLESRLADLDLYLCPANLYIANACTKTSNYTGSRTTYNNVEKIEFTATHTDEYLICVDKHLGQGSYEIIYAVSWMIDDGTLK